MVVTDPPYGVDYRGRSCSEWKAIAGDDDPGLLLPAFVELWRALKPNSFCLSFYGWPHADQFLSTWKMIGFRPVSHIVCIKNNIGLGYFTRGQHESAYLLAKGNPKRSDSASGDVIPWEREVCTYHPTQKPLQVISRLISFAEEDALILDPFMGSGTTLLAARNLGRRAIGIEIEEHYCKVAVERLAQQLFDFGPQRPKAGCSTPSLFDAAEAEAPWTA
jgi:site-specific DNA-methyltransferase (adenine-specific)